MPNAQAQTASDLSGVSGWKVADRRKPDTGLPFIEPKKDDAPFVYPAWGAVACAQEA